MKAITVPAILEQLGTVNSFIVSELDAADCSAKTRIQIETAVEEIYVNIARYAFHPDIGEATVHCEVGGDPLQVTIQFMDCGKPFNPFDKKDADTALSAEERDIGGLGILMVKKSMDAVDYVYKDGKNILTIKKKI